MSIDFLQIVPVMPKRKLPQAGWSLRTLKRRAEGESTKTTESEVELNAAVSCSEEHEANASVIEDSGEYAEEQEPTVGVMEDINLSDCEDSISVCEEDRFEDDLDELLEATRSLNDDLRELFVQHHNIPVNFTDDLLNILRDHHVNVAPNRSHLMGTISTPPKLSKIDDGDYLYFPLEQILCELNDKVQIQDEIEIILHIDGSKPAKSGSLSVWTLLGAVRGLSNVKPFVHGIYSGAKEPSNMDKLVAPLAEDLKKAGEGIRVSLDKRVKVVHRITVCDAPARGKTTHTPLHNSKCGCPFCFVVGGKKFDAKLNKKTGGTNFPTERGLPKTDALYAVRYPPEHFEGAIINGFSPLEILGRSMIYDFIPDPMHLLDLGLAKKKIDLIFSGTPAVKLSSKLQKDFHQLYYSFKSWTPHEFKRKPIETGPEKATDYHRILFYHGLVLFKQFLPADMYNHFIMLYTALRLMCDKKSCKNNADVAQDLLDRYVSMWPRFYGDNKVHYTVHLLLHLGDFVKANGPLYDITSYPFESKIGQIHNYLKSMNLPLSQYYRRINEYGLIQLRKPKQTGFIAVKQRLTIPRIYSGCKVQRGLQLESFRLSIKNRDSYCWTENVESGSSIVKVCGFVKIQNEIIMLAKPFLRREPFFTSPCDSNVTFGVCLVSEPGALTEYSINSIQAKMFAHPFDDAILVQPCLHTIFRED